ncbi:MAG: peptidase E [Candidatus Peribacteria bacterium]|nr:peptidase E [Candidatus Peribacteria bacterium]
MIAEELDLRKYFNNPKGLQEFLSKKSMVWIRGGNSFILSRAMIESGFSSVGVDMIKSSQIVYAGYSAALIVATTDLSGTEIVDDPTAIPNGYSKDTNPFIGLGLIDFYLIPHIDSKEEWAKNVPLHVKKLQEEKLEVMTLKDGEVFVVK